MTVSPTSIMASAGSRDAGGTMRRGDPFVFAAAGGLALTLFLLLGMLFLIASMGLGVFWPKHLDAYRLSDGRALMGVIRAEGETPDGEPRFNLQQGNRDVHGIDFAWIEEADVTQTERPLDAVVLERVEWGNFHGFLSELRTDAAQGLEGEALWDALEEAIETQEEKDKGLGDEAVFTTYGGDKVVVRTGEIVGAWRPNRMSFLSRAGHYVEHLFGFVVGQPRESNTEGGVWPALFGTCLMVMIMSVAVTPFGVIAALYLHEYAGDNVLVRAVRVAVANLAGVPSIVFGLFGLGFFVYGVGGTIDALFFSDSLPTPTFGTGGILWASLTLALLTLPVVIVATEESLAAVPSAQREGALALGATKWQSIRSVVLPASAPGILTGLILAVARGAGEVAPLMLTGAVKLAPRMPFDTEAPFFHFQRKFMHLGFHIYDLGFQSPNVEAAKPMVYATTVLLVGLVILLNVAAIRIRARLRKSLQGSAF